MLNLSDRMRQILLIGVVILVLIAVLYFIKFRKSIDNFEETKTAPEHQMETKVENLPNKPQFYDSGSGVVMASPEMEKPDFVSPWYQAYTGNLNNYYLLDDGEGGAAGLQYNYCSKSCCSAQYPVPFKLKEDPEVCANKSEFVPTNYTCNNAWQDTGCVCLTKKQSEFLGSRGGNA